MSEEKMREWLDSYAKGLIDPEVKALTNSTNDSTTSKIIDTEVNKTSSFNITDWVLKQYPKNNNK